MINRLEKVTSIIPESNVENISGIPLVITEQHQQVFPFWDHSEIKNVTLVHIDSHSDLADKSPVYNKAFDFKYHKKLEVGNFICPAVHYGLIKDMFWISPFCSEDKDIYIQYLNQNSLETKRGIIHLWWKNSEFSEKSRGGGICLDNDAYKMGESINSKQFKKQLSNNGTFILDIDLDAFAKKFQGQRMLVELAEAFGGGVEGWEDRIKRTINLLKKIPKPKLITLTRSQGDYYTTYVPSYLVDKVQDKTIEELKKLY